MRPVTRKKKMIQERFEEHDKVQGVNLASKFPNLNAVKPLWDMHEKQVWFMGAQPRNLQDLKGSAT